MTDIDDSALGMGPGEDPEGTETVGPATSSEYGDTHPTVTPLDSDEDIFASDKEGSIAEFPKSRAASSEADGGSVIHPRHTKPAKTSSTPPPSSVSTPSAKSTKAGKDKTSRSSKKSRLEETISALHGDEELTQRKRLEVQAQEAKAKAEIVKSKADVEKERIRADLEWKKAKLEAKMNDKAARRKEQQQLRFQAMQAAGPSMSAWPPNTYSQGYGDFLGTSSFHMQDFPGSDSGGQGAHVPSNAHFPSQPAASHSSTFSMTDTFGPHVSPAHDPTDLGPSTSGENSLMPRGVDHNIL